MIVEVMCVCLCTCMNLINLHVLMKAGKSFVYWWGTQPTMIVTNADDVKDLMSTHSKHYHKSTLMPVLVDRMFGQGIILASSQSSIFCG